MVEIRFLLNLSPQEIVAYYQGAASNVVAKSVDGRAVQFPAKILRPFVTHDGVVGLFALVYDANNKFVEIKRVGP
jgi:hypothetical protein